MLGQHRVASCGVRCFALLCYKCGGVVDLSKTMCVAMPTYCCIIVSIDWLFGGKVCQEAPLSANGLFELFITLVPLLLKPCIQSDDFYFLCDSQAHITSSMLATVLIKKTQAETNAKALVVTLENLDSDTSAVFAE